MKIAIDCGFLPPVVKRLNINGGYNANRIRYRT